MCGEREKEEWREARLGWAAHTEEGRGRKEGGREWHDRFLFPSHIPPRVPVPPLSFPSCLQNHITSLANTPALLSHSIPQSSSLSPPSPTVSFPLPLFLSNFLSLVFTISFFPTSSLQAVLPLSFPSISFILSFHLPLTTLHHFPLSHSLPHSSSFPSSLLPSVSFLPLFLLSFRHFPLSHSLSQSNFLSDILLSYSYLPCNYYPFPVTSLHHLSVTSRPAYSFPTALRRNRDGKVCRFYRRLKMAMQVMVLMHDTTKVQGRIYEGIALKQQQLFLNFYVNFCVRGIQVYT